MRTALSALSAALLLLLFCIPALAEETAEDYFNEGQRLMSEAFIRSASTAPDMGKAIEAFDKAIELMPGESRYYIMKASAQAMQNSQEAALVTLKQAIELAPESYEAYTAMSWVLYKLNRPEEAKKASADAILAIDSAISEEPSNTELYQKKVSILLSTTYNIKPEEAATIHEEAIKAIDEAIRIAPADETPYQFKAQILVDLNRSEDALATYDEGITKVADSYSLYLAKAQLLSSMDRVEEALKVTESAIALKPDDPQAYGTKVFIQQSLELYEDALETCSRLIELSPDSAVYFVTIKASLLEELGRSDEVDALYNELQKQHPDDAQTYFNIGNTLYYSERYEEALGYIEKGLELTQDDPFAYSTKASILTKLSRPEEAAEALCKSLGFAPYISYSYKQWKEAIDESFQGNETGRLAFYERSLPLFEGVIEKNPDSAHAYIYKWDILRTLHRDGDAAGVLDQAVALDAGSAASILTELEYHAEALAVLEKLTADRQDAGLFYQKATALKELNRYDEALAAYDVAKALTPNSTYYGEKGDLLAEMGRVDEALAAYDGAIKYEQYAAYAYYEKKGALLFSAGRYDEAVTDFGEALKLSEKSTDIQLELAFAMQKRAGEGDAGSASELLEQVLNGTDDEARVKALALLGRKDEMILLAADVVGDNTCIAASFRKDPVFEQYRSDPDFIAIVGSDEK